MCLTYGFSAELDLNCDVESIIYSKGFWIRFMDSLTRNSDMEFKISTYLTSSNNFKKILYTIPCIFSLTCKLWTQKSLLVLELFCFHTKIEVFFKMISYRHSLTYIPL